MKQKWLLLLLLLGSVLFFGCSADELQKDESIWVITEEISYDEAERVTNRKIYQYEDDPYHYRCTYYDGETILTYTDVTQSKNGKTRTEKTYQDEQLLSTEVYQYDIDGKEVSCEISFADGNTKREWHWSKDGRTVEITDDGMYLWSEEYDAQGRKIRSYGEDYETVYTYGEQETVLCTTYSNENRVEYVVHQYDEQGRVTETCNYELDTYEQEKPRPYTETDLIARTVFVYETDGHSYWMQSDYNDGTVQMESQTHVIYKPLEEALQ